MMQNIIQRKITGAWRDINSLVANKGDFKRKISPELLFLYQYHNGVLNRFDVVVRYVMVGYLLGENKVGKDLYEKMQKMRAQMYKKDEAVFLKKEESFITLIENLKAKGYNGRSFLSWNTTDDLCDGSHRLAAALYFKVSAVSVKRSSDPTVSYGLDFFSAFSESEKELLLLTEKKILESIDPKKVLGEILKSQKQDFGRGGFYQSFDNLGIEGQRPTLFRFKQYNLESYLSDNMSVLDIGSNCGFFSLFLSEYVKSIEGLEINQSLVNISNITKIILGVKNAHFVNEDFNNLSGDKSYDFILSFAVHHWIGQDIDIYVEKLWSLLNNEGYVLFESQNIETHDKDWDIKIQAFINKGFVEIENGEIFDDNKIRRNFSLFKKTK